MIEQDPFDSSQLELNILSVMLAGEYVDATRYALDNIPSALAFRSRNHQIIWLGCVRVHKRSDMVNSVSVAEALRTWSFDEAIQELRELLHLDYQTVCGKISMRDFRTLRYLTEQHGETDVWHDSALAAVGGYPCLMELTDGRSTPTLAGQIAWQVTELLEIYRHRAIDESLHWAHQRLKRPDGRDKVDAVVDGIERRASNLTPPSERIVEPSELILQHLDSEQEMYQPISCGIERVDGALDLHTGHFSIIGGWPGSAKSSWCAQIARHTAELVGKRGSSLFVSLEKPTAELSVQMAAQVCGIDTRLAYRNQLNQRQRQSMREAAAYLKGLGCSLVGSDAGVELDQIVRGIKQHVRSHPHCRVVIIDNLQLIRVNGSTNLFENVSAVTPELRRLRNELGVAILLVSHLTNHDKKNERPYPQIPMLRGGADLSMHVTSIVFLHAEHPDDMCPEVNIRLAKSNLGPLGEANAYFWKECQTIRGTPRPEVAAASNRHEQFRRPISDNEDLFA